MSCVRVWWRLRQLGPTTTGVFGVGALCVMLLLAASCKKIVPDPGVGSGFGAEAPSVKESGSLDPSSVVLERARLDASAHLPLEGLRAHLDSTIPKSFELVTPSDEVAAPEVRYRGVAQRGPLRMSLSPEGALLLEADVTDGVLATFTEKRREVTRVCGCDAEEWCGGVTGERRKAVIKWDVTLTTQGLGLVPTTTYVVEPLDGCTLGRGPGGEALRGAERMKELMQEALVKTPEQLTAHLSAQRVVSEQAALIWNELERARPVEEGRTQLILKPKSVAAGAVELVDEVAVIPLHFAVRPQLVSASSVVESTPLPEPSERIDARDFQLATIIELSYEDASAQLTESLKGMRFPPIGREYVQIETARVYGGGRDLVIELQMSGPVRGALYLVGKLLLEPEDMRFVVEELELDPSSARALGRLYHEFEHPDATVTRTPWFPPERLVEAVSREASWSIEPRVLALTAQLEEAGKRPLSASRKISLNVTRVSFSNVAAAQDAMQTITLVSGHVGVVTLPVEVPSR